MERTLPVKSDKLLDCFVVTLKIVLQNPNLHSVSVFLRIFCFSKFCRAFLSVPLRFHEFFVEIIENIVALKIILQNPNLVQKTSSDIKNYFHLLNFATFICVSLHFHKFFW
jgi:hypothetical protein